MDDKDEKINELNQRIKELETINSMLIKKVESYENMNVTKIIAILIHQYKLLEEKLRLAEEKMKQAEEYFGMNSSDTGLTGELAQELEAILTKKEYNKSETKGSIATILDLIGNMRQQIPLQQQ